jgi:hypothetical protein
VDGLACFSLAESLGGVESLVAHPATMTHASMDAESQRIAGITPGLLRVSVGTEDPADLVADLLAGLERSASVGVRRGGPEETARRIGRGGSEPESPGHSAGAAPDEPARFQRTANL